MDEALVKRALKLYEVKYKRILPPQSGYRNTSYPVEKLDGQWLNFVVFKREPGIVARVRRTDEVAAFLHAGGFPTRTNFDNRILRLEANRYAGLYYYLPGETIPWEAYTMAHLKLLGKTMSDMHAMLAKYKNGLELPDVTREYQGLIKRVKAYFASPGVQTALHQKLGVSLASYTLANSTRVLQLAARLEPKQVLHMDFVRGNILFSKSESQELIVSGILDFEKAVYGHKLFDIARTLAFLLVDCKYKPAEKIYKYFLHSGYQKYGAAGFADITHRHPREGGDPVIMNSVSCWIPDQAGNDVSREAEGKLDALEALIDLCLLHDFYKFLRYNPYEFLGQNEHYQRTVALLIERGLLRLL